MVKVRPQGEKIRQFIMNRVANHPRDIGKIVADEFHITRQAANKHLRRLVAARALVGEGKTKNQRYSLVPLSDIRTTLSLADTTSEDVVWREHVQPALEGIPTNVLDIWRYGFTEMFNNVIDHSEGTSVTLRLKRTAADCELYIIDDGVGIFRKIQSRLELEDERHAVLELAKGKLTTDPTRHTGEGIFFTSRMFDQFAILSGDTYFSHTFGDPRDWIVENKGEDQGTTVLMRQNNHSSRTTTKVFAQFSSGEELAFTKTVVPVRLAQYGQDKLVSRSQAKRLLARVDRFKTVLFDFEGVEEIGPAFADELFRVFPAAHPDIEIHELKTNDLVKQMIARARIRT